MADERNVFLYRATMAVVKKMLDDGLISEEEYGEIDNDDKHIAEQMILNEIRQEYLINPVVKRPNDSVAKDLFF